MGGEENFYALVCIPRTSMQVKCVFVVVFTLTACGY